VRLQVRISAGATSHQGLLSLPSLRVGKRVPAAAGKAKAGMAHSDYR